MTRNMEMMQDIEEVLHRTADRRYCGAHRQGNFPGLPGQEPASCPCVKGGSVVFMADLMRSIDIPARIDFMATSSYGSG